MIISNKDHFSIKYTHKPSLMLVWSKSYITCQKPSL